MLFSFELSLLETMAYRPYPLTSLQVISAGTGSALMTGYVVTLQSSHLRVTCLPPCFTADNVRLRTQYRRLVHISHDVDALTGERWTNTIGI
jgi:hypothetical protein